MKEIDEMMAELESLDDVGQRRYLMYCVFEQILRQVYEELPEPEQRIQQLKDGNGYLYKIAQDFLTESSTMKKEEKLGKMVDYLRQN